MNIFRKNIYPIIILSFLLLLLLFPESALKGAASGLLLWFNTILPTLLPFVIISNLIIRLNYTKYIIFLFSPILTKLFSISKNGCYPVIIGILSGFPMGAKTSADMTFNNKISKKEGQFLLALCNNASIMFITGYAAVSCLKIKKAGIPLLIILYMSSFLSSTLFYCANNKKKIPKMKYSSDSVEKFKFEYLDEAILDGFTVLTKVGGYIMIFSILASIIEKIFSQTIPSIIFIGSMEITTGLNNIGLSVFTSKTKIILTAMIAAFGGFSSLFQTYSVLGKSGLSIKEYFFTKLTNAIFAMVLSIIYVTFFY